MIRRYAIPKHLPNDNVVAKPKSQNQALQANPEAPLKSKTLDQNPQLPQQ